MHALTIQKLIIMKTIFTFLLSILLFGFTESYSQTSEVSATFIGSHGYLLESDTQKIALDALMHWEGNHYGYIKPPVSVKEKVLAAETPFDNIDLILISHAHQDHYNVEIINQSMLLNPEAILICPSDVYSDIKNNTENFDDFKNRTWSPQLELYNSIDTAINYVDLFITKIEHGNINLFVYSFLLNNIRFTQLNSWNSITSAMYDTLSFNKVKTDVMFLGYDYLLNSAKSANFKNKLNADFFVVSHIDGAGQARFDAIQSKINELSPDYSLSLLKTPMETYGFSKTHDELIIDTLNLAPAIVNTIDNKTFMNNQEFEYILPENLFTDDEKLNCMISLISPAVIPEWLTINNENLSIFGNPEKKFVLSFKIIASDPSLAEASQTFKIFITETVSEQLKLSDQLKIYPNPADEVLTITGLKMDNNTHVNLYSLHGTKQSIKKRNVNNELLLQIYDLIPGIYVLTVENNYKKLKKLIQVE